jgi:hypothetical protein
MVRRLWRPDLANYLRRNGVNSQRAVDSIVAGFDFNHSVYEQPLSVGEVYFQFARTPSHDDPSPTLGSWFCLKGESLGKLGIHSPGAARRVGEFEVVEDVIAVEGVAKWFDPNTELAKYGIGGEGGGTQIYLPPKLRTAVRFRGLYVESGDRALP